jgi:hypothetical protein
MIAADRNKESRPLHAIIPPTIGTKSMKMKPSRDHLVAALWLVLPLAASAEDWSQFRGPTGQGVHASGVT